MNPEPPDPNAIVTLQPLVRSIVDRYFRNVPGNIAGQDDLEQIGMLAVIAAADRWQPGRASWRAYAYRRAHGAMQDHLRQCAHGPRSDPNRYEILSLDHPVDTTDVTLGDTIEDPHTIDPDPLLTAAVDRALATLTPTEQTILELVHDQDLAPRQIADLLGITPGAASQQAFRARRKLAADPNLRNAA